MSTISLRLRFRQTRKRVHGGRNGGDHQGQAPATAGALPRPVSVPIPRAARASPRLHGRTTQGEGHVLRPLQASVRQPDGAALV